MECVIARSLWVFNDYQWRHMGGVIHSGSKPIVFGVIGLGSSEAWISRSDQRGGTTMKMNPKAVKLLVLIWVFGLLHSAPVRAQVSGATLSGAITDAQGGAVAGAKVSIKNLGTGIVTEATTNDTGAYSVP